MSLSSDTFSDNTTTGSASSAGGNLALESTGPTISLPNAQPGDGGEYFVVVQNSAGSVTSQVAVVTVLVERMLILGSTADVNEGDLVNRSLVAFSALSYTLTNDVARRFQDSGLGNV